MPMDYKYIELELDAVEERGAGRVPQETARSDSTPMLSPYPKGIPKALLEHKKRKTKEWVEAEITRVRKEGGF